MALMDKIERMLEVISEAVGDVAQGTLGTRELHTLDENEVRAAKSNKEQALEWLKQRQAYVDDAMNGRKQSMGEVLTEMRSDFGTMRAPEWHDWQWDNDKGEYVRAPDRSSKE